MFITAIESKTGRQEPIFFISNDEWEYWQERAAIMEYEGGLSRKQAEKSAYECLLQQRDRYAKSA